MYEIFEKWCANQQPKWKDLLRWMGTPGPEIARTHTIAALAENIVLIPMSQARIPEITQVLLCCQCCDSARVLRFQVQGVLFHRSKETKLVCLNSP